MDDFDLFFSGILVIHNFWSYLGIKLVHVTVHLTCKLYNLEGVSQSRKENIVHTIHFTLYATHFTLLIAQSTLQMCVSKVNIETHFRLYTQCILNTAHYADHTAHCTELFRCMDNSDAVTQCRVFSNEG